MDPELTISDNTHGANAIEDVSIYLSKPTTNGNWTYLHSGYYDSTYGVARTLFRLEELIGSSIYESLDAGHVSSAYFYIWEASGTTTANVYLKANRGSSTWTESGATWSNAGVTLGTTYAICAMTSNAKAAFDITYLARAWRSGNEAPQKGFVLQSSNETSLDKAFYSSEYGTTSYRPYVTLTYATAKTFYYKNYYDSTVAGSYVLLSGMRNAAEVSNTAYSRLFPVRFEMTGGYTPKLSEIPSTCTTGDESPCDFAICGSPCGTNHHKNLARISDTIMSWERPDDHISVFWTDRGHGTYCMQSSSGHKLSYLNALVMNSQPAIHIMDLTGSSTEEIKAYMAIHLIHETAHVFGMPDVYGDGHDVENGWICVMEYYEQNWTKLRPFYEKIEDGTGDAFCESCKVALSMKIKPITIEGNQ